MARGRSISPSSASSPHAQPGDLPSEVRVEKILTFSFPGAALKAGGGFASRDMSIYAYQLIYPNRTIMVDTGMDEASARDGIPVKEYDTAAWKRLQAALPLADLSVITHEHVDHIGGLIASEPAYQRALLNPEQQAHPENLKPLKYPTAVKARTIEYSGATAVAPGVVLIRSPGHTPGSQMVFVTRADGTELLFLGDVAWQMDNVLERRERPRLLTMLIKEDRGQVLQELEALHTLHEKSPEVNIVPGHDPSVVAALIQKGVLKPEFVTTAPVPPAAPPTPAADPAPAAAQ